MANGSGGGGQVLLQLGDSQVQLSDFRMRRRAVYQQGRAVSDQFFTSAVQLEPAGVVDHPRLGSRFDGRSGHGWLRCQPLRTDSVLADDEGDFHVATGGVYSFYEFPWPTNDRLNDETWWRMLRREETPPRPGWQDPIFP